MSDMVRVWRAAATACAFAGRELRGIREAQHVTLGDLAVMTGTDKPTLSRIETGQLIPDPDLLERLDAVLQHAEKPANPEQVPAQPRTRTGDPRSSQFGVAELAADRTTKQLVRDAIGVAALVHDDGRFTDSDLVAVLAQAGTPKPRSIVARYRGWEEEAGRVERVGCYPDRVGRTLLHFRRVAS